MPAIKKMNWTSFKKKYGACRECELCEGRDKIVLAKGTIPCDVLFIGEAPGASEDVFGKPFVGPAGKLLHRVIDSALSEFSATPKMAFTNLVCCIPRDEDGVKVHEPKKEHVQACYKRLQDFADLCDPQLIIFVGKFAEKYGGTLLMNDHLVANSISHPAAVLRADVSQQELMAQRMEAILIRAFNNLVPF